MRSLALAAAVLALLAGDARADKESDARVLFSDANAHFAIGDFLVAAKKYQAAFLLHQDPALLYNAAQAFRLGGAAKEALVVYKNYLLFYPHPRNEAEVRAQIVKLTEAIASEERAKTAPPTTVEAKPEMATHTPAPPPSAIAGAAAHPAAAQPAAATAENRASLTARAPERRPIYKRWWLWTTVGGVVAVAAVATAVAVTTTSTPWSTTPAIGPGQTQALVRW